MRFVLAADLPPASPLITPFGEIHTSILSPGPAFAALDGLGLFGPPDPTAVADPGQFLVATIPAGTPPGLTLVVQFYGLDEEIGFPRSIVVSPPRTLVF